MKIQKAVLLSTIESWLKDREKRTEKFQLDKTQHEEGYKKSWFRHEAKGLVAVAELIQFRIGKNEVITRDDVSAVLGKYLNSGKSYYSFNDSFYSEPSITSIHGVYPPNPQVTQTLKSLKNFLELVEDETVSTTSLERMGFRDLNALFLAALETQKGAK
jgi:hypothetical protein